MSFISFYLILRKYNQNKKVNTYEKKLRDSKPNTLNKINNKNQKPIVIQSNKVKFSVNKGKSEEEEEESEEESEKVKVVYDGMTLDELADKLDRSLNSTMSGKGYLIASRSIELGVDPYMATAIILQETGCKWECSYMVKTCNNVGGQKGSGCGDYSYFNSLDEGIINFIDNLYYNYVSYGLTTPEAINPKYAESQSWSINVNRYIVEIKAQ